MSQGPQRPIALHHKLTPPGLPEHVVQRSRLDDLIGELFAGRRVIACVGPAGSGKTVQAQLYARQAGMPMAWLTLEAADKSPSRFLARSAAALGSRSVDGVAQVQAGLLAGWSAPEAAAIFAETIQPDHFLLVVDECEAVMSSDDTLSALATLLEYAPPTMRTMLLSREPFRGALLCPVLDGLFGELVEDDLRLTPGETRQILTAHGLEDVNATEAHEATGGWMAGLVFGFRHSVNRRSDRRAADLSAYIGHEILGVLPPEERAFLLDTSVVDVVTSEVAQALVGPAGQALFQRIRDRCLPATTIAGGELVCHSVLRSYLRAELRQLDPERELELRRRHAEYLMSAGDVEAATDVLLDLDDLDHAADAAERALPMLYPRGDWQTLTRWLDRLGEGPVGQRPVLVAARIRALYGSGSVQAAASLIEQLEERDELRLCTAADSGLPATIALALESKPTHALRLLDEYESDYRSEAVRYMLEVFTGVTPAAPPPVRMEWDIAERSISSGLLWQGRFAEILRFAPEAEDLPVMNVTVLLAYIWRGEVEQARAMWGRVPREIRERSHSQFVEAWMLVAEGECELALLAIERAMEESRRTGAGTEVMYEVFAAHLLIRVGRIEDGSVLVQRLIDRITAGGNRAVLEWAQMTLGLALLVADRPDDAELVLDECVRSMQAAGRRLFLPPAAVYLAEAKYRLGRPDDATTAQLARQTASIAGSEYVLAQALGAAPNVLGAKDIWAPTVLEQRQQKWDRLGRPSARVTADPVMLDIQPFGSNPELSLDGRPVAVGRVKVLELAACLVLYPDGIERFELQRLLFPDVDQRRGGNYFRQIVHALRKATGISLVRSGTNIMMWPGHVRADAADLRFERLCHEARHTASEDVRLEGLLEALGLITGPYLEKSDLLWVEERRRELELLQEETFVETSHLLLDAGRELEARDLGERLLELNPYSHPTHRLLLEVERRVGTEASRMAVYRRVVEALKEIALEPDDELRGIMKLPSATPAR